MNLGGERALNKNEKGCFKVTHAKEETVLLGGYSLNRIKGAGYPPVSLSPTVS